MDRLVIRGVCVCGGGGEGCRVLVQIGSGS